MPCVVHCLLQCERRPNGPPGNLRDQSTFLRRAKNLPVSRTSIWEDWGRQRRQFALYRLPTRLAAAKNALPMTSKRTLKARWRRHPLASETRASIRRGRGHGEILPSSMAGDWNGRAQMWSFVHRACAKRPIKRGSPAVQWNSRQTARSQAAQQLRRHPVSASKRQSTMTGHFAKDLCGLFCQDEHDLRFRRWRHLMTVSRPPCAASGSGAKHKSFALWKTARASRLKQVGLPDRLL